MQDTKGPYNLRYTAVAVHTKQTSPPYTKEFKCCRHVNNQMEKIIRNKAQQRSRPAVQREKRQQENRKLTTSDTDEPLVTVCAEA